MRGVPKAGSRTTSQPGPRPAAKSYNSSRSQIVYDATRPRYKQWRGRHRFFCGGRIMMGPNVKQVRCCVCVCVCVVRRSKATS